ncbi:54S ribosomal protein L15, mitochondrial [[Candida] anglica]|uniref:54S ribosomal protein L15, mitochondrial n=1 Tax=[Candida] anglica TaxID=148631 RepID=A0ABP0EG76_9ASCO
MLKAFGEGSRMLSSRTLAVNPARTIYLHSGKRVQGLKKNPEDVFKTHNGAVYGPSHENLQYVKAFLQDKYSISDDLALQVLTHKSFGNGIKPYNEKLAALGSKLVSLFFLKYATNQPTTNETAINGKNMDCIGMPLTKSLSERAPMAFLAQQNNLNKVMFWKSYNHDLSFGRSGELKVSAQMVYALVGAVAFSHGKVVAEQFIQDRFVNATPSLDGIASKLLEENIRSDKI